MTSPGSHASTALLLDGFAAAVGRVTAASLPTSAGFHAMFESLAWAGAVKDRFEDEKISPPPRLNGLWYVRNLTLHQGADVVFRVTGYGTGAFGSGPFGGVGFGGGAGAATLYMFPPSSALPRPRSDKGRCDYESEFVDTEIVASLNAAVRDATRAYQQATNP